MGNTDKWKISPMKMKPADLAPLIERAYRQAKPFQWLREGIMNAIEAGAKKISLEVEPEGISGGIYRYAIYDNGTGMTKNDFNKFLFYYGVGAKPIGGVDEHFGIGLKVCMLPWNRYGLVVVSVKSGIASMCWMYGQRYEEEGRIKTQYGPRVWCTEEEGDILAILPIEMDGIDFEKTIPKWIGTKGEDGIWRNPSGKLAHGTILILMGNNGNEDTILGDPNRSESLNLKSGERSFWPDHMYIESRFWEIPEGVEITVKMPTNVEKENWPSREEWETGVRGEKKLTLRRYCRGAKDWISHPYGVETGNIPAPLCGTVDVEGPIPAKIHWFLRDKNFPKNHWHKGKSLGYIGALYSNEIYDRSESREHGIQTRYNKFGIYHSDLQRSLFLIAEPQPMTGEGSKGVYPIDSRSHLIYGESSGTGFELPWEEWGEDFRRKMPEEISSEIERLERGISSSGIDVSKECMQRVAHLGHKFVIQRPFIISGGGPVTNLEIAVINRPSSGLRRPQKPQSPPESLPVPDERRDSRYIPAVEGGPLSGVRKNTKCMLPTPEWRSKEEFEAPWVFARFERSNFKVFLNLDHDIYKQSINDAMGRWSATKEDVIRAVQMSYGSSIITKVAHVLCRKKTFVSPEADGGETRSTDQIVEELLSPTALTTALMGFHDLENDLKRQLGYKGTKEEGKIAA